MPLIGGSVRQAKDSDSSISGHSTPSSGRSNSQLRATQRSELGHDTPPRSWLKLRRNRMSCRERGHRASAIGLLKSFPKATLALSLGVP